ncbi:outer membrane biogenesis protein BamB [Stieleria neptunia]|uniref:Outer membrane biogenesis protein BamB n=2 Tax=Stieleria neptunia TaxID=2527979 RepID=A0A518HHG3_9BACT|nr:outer membrane biogenesis protein BamB [Stieleria neptunia]
MGSNMIPATKLVIGCLTILTAATLGNHAAADRWSQFRGDQMDGIARTQHPQRWSETDNVRWSVEVPGEGWSCPVVWGNQVFLTAAVPVTESASTGPEKYSGGGGSRRDDLTGVTYRWQVICLDATTGKEIWRQTAREGRPTMGRHSSNTYATETPATDGRHVYAYFGMTGLYCFDMAGNKVWEKDLGSYPMRAGWGTSSSPVLFDDKLFLQVDNEQQSFLVAIDAQTGDEVWRVDRQEKSQYSSPILWSNSRRDELIVGGMHYRSYDPQTGTLLWELDMEKGRSSATPLAVGDRLYVGTEYRNRGGADDGGGFLFAIKPGGSGDITPPAGRSQTEHVAWKIERSGIQMASPAYCNGNLYLLERRSGVIHCVDTETGSTVYRSRVPRARAFWSSPWTDSDRVYCVDTSGATYVLASGDELNVLGTNEIDEMTWSTPAIADAAVYFRTASKLYCIATP